MLAIFGCYYIGTFVENYLICVPKIYKVFNQLFHAIIRVNVAFFYYLLYTCTFAVVYTIEFQKRGLPHCHILLFFITINKAATSKNIDKVICAEIPDKDKNPKL